MVPRGRGVRGTSSLAGRDEAPAPEVEADGPKGMIGGIMTVPRRLEGRESQAVYLVGNEGDLAVDWPSV
jgi:hypothetical protein